VAQVTLGNHAAVVVSLTEQDAVRRFYRDVLGCALTRSAHDKDDFVLGVGRSSPSSSTTLPSATVRCTT
jgi:hypothetical protein